MANILVYTEQRGGEYKSATLSAVTMAQAIIEKDGGSYSIAVLGSGVESIANDVAKFGAEKVYLADAAALEYPLPDVYATALAELAKQVGATHVLATASTISKDFIPRVAAKLGAGMVSEAVEVLGAKSFKRPMWAGNVLATVEVETDIVVATARGTDFDKAAPVDGVSPIEKVDVTATLAGCSFVKWAPTVSARPELTEAAAVVSGGRGLKSADGFDNVLGPLCDVLNAAMGATRSVVDSGFVPNALQVGQTGKIVAPDLYIAVGLSGAIQHLAGMKNSKVIVAINKDEEAPIFTVADYGLVDDLFKVVPPMTAAIKAQKALA